MIKLLRFLAMAMLLWIPSVTKAQVFEVGGITYNVLSQAEQTAEVAPSCSRYRGNINIPSVVTHDGITYDVVALGEMAFYGCTLSSVSIPSSVTKIKYGCFLFANGPATITLPSSVKDIDVIALAANNLTAIAVDENNPYFMSIDGMLFSKDTATLVACPSSKRGVITLPQSTRHIAPLAFAYCQNITAVPLPEGLSSIGYWAFVSNTNLNNVVIPASVVHIGYSPFTACSSLDNLTLSEGNTHYYMDGMLIYSAGGDSLLSAHKSSDSLTLPSTLRYVNGFGGNSNIKYVRLPDSATTIGKEAFNSSSLKSIDLPSQMRLIDESAFYYCQSLTHVSMPATLNTMGGAIFEECSNLTSIAIPNGLRVIPQSAFYFCESLSQITWGDAVAVIDSFAFGGCAFSELQLPSTLHSVRTGAFEGYYNGVLRRVVFTAPVDTIELEAFTSNPLTMLRFKNTVPPVTTEPQYGCLYMTDVDSIVVPCGSLDAWLNDQYWGQFADKYYEDCNGIADTPEMAIAVYPNPASTRLTIGGVDGKGMAELVNAAGQTVLSHPINGTPSEIDVSTLPRGHYFLRLHTSNSIVTHKVILN